MTTPNSGWTLFQFWNVHPGALAPALGTEFGQLYSLGRLEQIPFEVDISGIVAQEQLPLHLEGVVIGIA